MERPVYFGNLMEPLSSGHAVIVSGRLSLLSERFDINLASGKNPHDKIGLHLSWRVKEKIIVRNSLDNGWGAEERNENRNHASKDNPLTRGGLFQILIAVNDGRFDISVNQTPYCHFNFRMSPFALNTIQIFNDIKYMTEVNHRRLVPITYPLKPHRAGDDDFCHDFPSQPFPGQVIVITGMLSGNPKGKFEISFGQGTQKKQALHISTRFNKNVIVFNTRDDIGNWGVEERQTYIPFGLHSKFRIAIALGAAAFHISINGVKFTDFIYRDGYQSLNGFSIKSQNRLNVQILGVDHMKDYSFNCIDSYQFSHLGHSLIRNF